MPRIEIKTEIHADIVIVFDLSRSVDLHKISTKHTNETAIAGTTSGLMGKGDSVTWRAKHLGLYQKLSSQITEFDRPTMFVDEMVQGAFKSFRHEHHFQSEEGITTMTDIFDYVSPLGWLGTLADHLFLKRYMTQLLVKRNETIKTFAESERYKEVL